jgi:DNA modification methylase
MKQSIAGLQEINPVTARWMNMIQRQTDLDNLFPLVLIQHYEIVNRDALSTLQSIPSETIDCCVTSPPYYGLRSYLPAEHENKALEVGYQETVPQYVDRLVTIFKEVARVVKNDGTIWLNLGDSYVTDSSHGCANLKRKDLIGIPWAVAFALRDSGLYLRSDIIWSKPNPMPDGAKDRPTKAHEYLFLLTKSEHYYYNAAAIREPNKVAPHAHGRSKQAGQITAIRNAASDAASRQPDRIWAPNGGRNKRSVWSINVRPFKGAHFATFPTKLIEPCVLAGCPPDGIVLDPFSGAATSGLTALMNGRRYLGIELNKEYCALSEQRLKPFAAPEVLSPWVTLAS